MRKTNRLEKPITIVRSLICMIRNNNSKETCKVWPSVGSLTTVKSSFKTSRDARCTDLWTQYTNVMCRYWRFSWLNKRLISYRKWAFNILGLHNLPPRKKSTGKSHTATEQSSYINVPCIRYSIRLTVGTWSGYTSVRHLSHPGRAKLLVCQGWNELKSIRVLHWRHQWAAPYCI